MHFSYSASGSVSVHIQSLEERSWRLLIGCRAFCAKWIYKLQHQLRQMSPGGEVVRIGRVRWWLALPQVKRGWERQTSEVERMDRGKVWKLLTIWPWVSSEFSPHKSKLLWWQLWLQELMDTSASISNTKGGRASRSLEEKTVRHLSWKSTSKLCKGTVESITSY